MPTTFYALVCLRGAGRIALGYFSDDQEALRVLDLQRKIAEDNGLNPEDYLLEKCQMDALAGAHKSKIVVVAGLWWESEKQVRYTLFSEESALIDPGNDLQFDWQGVSKRSFFARGQYLDEVLLHIRQSVAETANIDSATIELVQV